MGNGREISEYVMVNRQIKLRGSRSRLASEE